MQILVILGLNPNGTGQALSESQLKKPSKQATKENKKGRSNTFKPRNKYESLMPQSVELADSRRAGYQDYLDEKMEIGDSIDLNTTDYRYIGYFPLLEKHLIWFGDIHQKLRVADYKGRFLVRFTILKSGKLEVRQSRRKLWTSYS